MKKTELLMIIDYICKQAASCRECPFRLVLGFDVCTRNTLLTKHLEKAEQVAMKWKEEHPELFQTLKEGAKKPRAESRKKHNTQRPCTIAESIEHSCQEVKLMREGKVPKRDWKEFKREIDKEDVKDYESTTLY